jgi:uncharacterized membrane protein YccF (DUF307 family)
MYFGRQLLIAIPILSNVQWSFGLWGYLTPLPELVAILSLVGIGFSLKGMKLMKISQMTAAMTSVFTISSSLNLGGPIILQLT